MPITTEAYIARPGKEHDLNISLESVTYAPLAPKDVYIDIVASSLCHTDVKAAEGGFHISPPLILGHEAAGYVREIGSAVSYVQKGDAVVLSFASCERCRRCVGGQSAYCEELMGWNFSGRAGDGEGEGGKEGGGAVKDGKGETIKGFFFGQSSMARVAMAHESSCVKVEVKSKEELVLCASLGCGIQTGAGAILNVAKPPVGSSIAIWGGGAVGLTALLMAKRSTPARLVLIDNSSQKLDMIPKELLEGVHTINSTGLSPEALAQKLKELSPDGQGMDYALDCVGHSAILEAGSLCLAKLGMLMTIGATGQAEAKLPTQRMLVYGLTYRGMHQGDSVSRAMIPQMIGLWHRGQFPFEKLLTNYKFDELHKALEDTHAGRTIKPVLVV